MADLGCGLGILGLLRLEAGLEKVWGTDSSDAIHLARQIAERADTLIATNASKAPLFAWACLHRAAPCTHSDVPVHFYWLNELSCNRH